MIHVIEPSSVSLIESEEQARELEALLRGNPWPVGLDTETEGCNPGKQSPVENARAFCLTLAWMKPWSTECAFVPGSLIPSLRCWLEDDGCKKVGTNIFQYDRHVLANHGVTLRGIVGDTIRMSRLLNPSKHGQHGLKPLGESLGFTVQPYSAVASRPGQGVVKEYKRVQTRKGKTTGGEYQLVRWGTQEMIPLSELWEQYPQRRERLVEYAVQDAVMSLHGYYHLKERLAEVKW